MLKQLRQIVQEQLADLPARRRPALRRCDAPDMLLATDLPLIADEATVRRFLHRMEDKGWRTRMERGWLLMDASVPSPEQWCVPPRLEGESGCCISLLLRHPGDLVWPEQLRALLKAAESDHLERYCIALHKELAACLRRHETLPGALLPHLCAAYRKKEEL